MFVLAELRETIKVPPWNFKTKLNDAIVEALNKKFANKVVYKLGLCITLWDVTNIGDSYILPGDGATYTTVTFRYVVFRPFIDEILVGRVKSCGSEGIYVTLDFFDDIFIPADSMPEPSMFAEADQLWYWEVKQEEASHKLYLDIGEEIRFKVVDEVFVDTTPSGPTVVGELAAVADSDKKTPYSLIASIHDQGLGMTSWWVNPA